MYVIFFILPSSYSPDFASKRCAPASIRLVDNAQFQFGKYVDHHGVSCFQGLFSSLGLFWVVTLLLKSRQRAVNPEFKLQIVP